MLWHRTEVETGLLYRFDTCFEGTAVMSMLVFQCLHMFSTVRLKMI